MRLISRVLVIVVMLLPKVVFSSVPGQVNFQGVLLSDTNQVVNGNVDFNFSLYDAATSGAQLWSEGQTGVSVDAGIYTVALGSVVPLTVDILNGDAVYLEVSVGGEILSPRQRLLAVPYALKAEEAENVGGISGAFIQQLFLNVDWDGQGIANDDPLEGFADLDGDGLANFIDPDNDGDSISDDVEVSNGSGVNLVTPILNAVSPAAVDAGVLNTVTVSGSGFIAGLTAQIGTENPVPFNVTSTSFDINVGIGQSAGSIPLIVTNPNGEVANTSSILFYVYENLVFVTSQLKVNALSQSLSTADAFCAQLATDAGLTGSFVAWFSSPELGISAKDRIPVSAGPWSRTDGQVVAENIADLIDGSIAQKINLDENGVSVGTVQVATRTFGNGTVSLSSCFGTSSPDTGIVGNTGSTDVQWTSGTNAACTTSLRYYCFEE